MEHPYLWAIFGLTIVGLLVLDLRQSRGAATLSLRRALLWSALWIGLAVAFMAGIAVMNGREAALQFSAGYLLEEALSIDNLFVFLVIFRHFRVAPAQQHRVLFWGVIGAIVMRALFIFGAVGLVSLFSVTFYVFGGILLWSAWRMFRGEDLDVEPEHSWLVRLARKLFPFTAKTDGDRFFLVENGRKLATPLFLVLLIVEASDLLFAVDSIPAVLAISNKFFIVFTSNVFAILGLRSMYFVLQGLLTRFRFLSYGLAVILAFIGIKMILQPKEGIHQWIDWEPSITVTLGMIGGILCLAVLASWLAPTPAAARAADSTPELPDTAATPALPAQAAPSVTAAAPTDVPPESGA